MREQHLRAVQAVFAQLGLVGLHQSHLTDGGGGLQLVQSLRAACSSPGAACLRRWHRWTPAPVRVPCCASVAICCGTSCRCACDVEPAALVGDQAAADLDHDAPAPGAALSTSTPAGNVFEARIGLRTASSGTEPRLRNRRDQIGGSLRGQPPRWEHGLLAAAGARNPLTRCSRSSTGNKIDLVQHQPARLARPAPDVVLLEFARRWRGHRAPDRRPRRSGTRSTKCSSSRGALQVAQETGDRVRLPRQHLRSARGYRQPRSSAPVQLAQRPR